MFKYDKTRLNAVRKKLVAKNESLKKAIIKADELLIKADEFCAEVRTQRIEKLKQAQNQ